MIIDAYDESKTLVDIGAFLDKIDPICDTVICAFSRHVVDYVLKKYSYKVIPELEFGSCNGHIPLYYLEDLNVLFIMASVSSTMAGCLMEELAYSTGVKNFIFFGSCGLLDKQLKNKIIVPTSSYRDEGLSYHYMKPSDYVDIKNYKVVEKVMKDNNIPYALGKSWTTDGVYRETLNNVNKRKKDGCVCVEMESSGLQAVANFLNVNYYTFFLTGDIFDTESWSIDDLSSNKEKEKQFSSFEIALLLKKEIEK